MNNDVVVVGAGQAAAQLSISLRQGGFRGAIRVVGDEPYPPYQRPPLSKKFLSERPAADTLYLRPQQFWRDQEVALELGVAAASLDLRNRRLMLADGRQLPFGTLVLATGTRARSLPVPGTELAGVYAVRRIADVETLRPALDAAQRMLIVGGGYIGLEVAAVARGEGRVVTVIEAEDRVMKRVAGPAISGYFDGLHRARGVAIALNARLAAIMGDRQATGIRLQSGEQIPCDLVLVAAGARANDDLASQAGLACADGVMVDEQARTAAEFVYAIGDCARFPSRRFGGAVRLECVQNAIDQAKAVAAGILGQPQSYDPVPWFWSDQYEIKLQIAGLLNGYDQETVVGRPESGRFSVEYRRAGRLIAVDAVNEARAHMLGRRRVAEETGATASTPSS
jgi:3-phenylpropionate/trans-cinnamate dioxygenase ferredoxin reductase subunit